MSASSFSSRPLIRPFLLLFLWVVAARFSGSGSAAAGEVVDPSRAKTDAAGKTAWYSIRLLEVEGQGWTETKAPFDRLPARAEKIVRAPVWSLSRHSAGLCVRFLTDATTLQVRWTLTSPRLAMPHMPATGVSGVDLYVRRPNGQWHWLAVGFPRQQTNTARLFSDIPPGEREFLLYLPLYNGVSSVELGLPRKAVLRKASPRSRTGRLKPILFYGTSITQGGCASRPGMVHTAILGRRFDRPVLNFGFSGNGRMEPEMAHLFAELDPAVYVLDCLPNMNGKMVAERVVPFVRILRKKHPQTPILLVEDRSYANAFLMAGKRQRNSENRKALRAAFAQLKQAGDSQLYYLPGENLLGSDGEATVDSSHPTDLGFVRQSDAFERVLRRILSEKASRPNR